MQDVPENTSELATTQPADHTEVIDSMDAEEVVYEMVARELKRNVTYLETLSDLGNGVQELSTIESAELPGVLGLIDASDYLSLLEGLGRWASYFNHHIHDIKELNAYIESGVDFDLQDVNSIVEMSRDVLSAAYSLVDL